MLLLMMLVMVAIMIMIDHAHSTDRHPPAPTSAWSGRCEDRQEGLA
jgi:hypothetical protein